MEPSQTKEKKGGEKELDQVMPKLPSKEDPLTPLQPPAWDTFLLWLWLIFPLKSSVYFFQDYPTLTK